MIQILLQGIGDKPHSLCVIGGKEQPAATQHAVPEERRRPVEDRDIHVVASQQGHQAAGNAQSRLPLRERR